MEENKERLLVIFAVILIISFSFIIFNNFIRSENTSFTWDVMLFIIFLAVLVTIFVIAYFSRKVRCEVGLEE